jgi:hypothetical protein
MDEQDNGQAIVEITVSTDFEDFKEDWKNLGIKETWKKLMIAIIIFALSFFIAYVISAITRTTVITGFSGNTVTGYSNNSFWALNYLLSLLPAGHLIMVLRELYNSRPAKLFETYKRVFYIDSPRRYVFTEGCLICTFFAGPHHHSRIEVNYEHYTETRESKLSFYLFKPEGGAIILPKKCFTEDQITALHDFLTRKYGEKFKEITP